MSPVVLEKLSLDSLEEATRLFLALWPDCSYAESYQNCLRILDSGKETMQLARISDQYVGFIYLSLRQEYVEGIYMVPAYRKRGIGANMVSFGEHWGISQGATAYASDTELHNKAGVDFHIQTGFREANKVVCFVKNLTGDPR